MILRNGLLIIFLSICISCVKQIAINPIGPDSLAGAFIQGKVTDEQGRGISGVSISIESQSLPKAIITETDESGYYYLANVPPSRKYKMVVSAAGYTDHIRPLDVEPFVHITLDYQMTIGGDDFNFGGLMPRIDYNNCGGRIIIFNDEGLDKERSRVE